MANTLGEANPYRYQGYRFDTESGLFYVGSRYYDPEIGRFINADIPESMILQSDSSIHAINLFAYCFNNPVNYADHTGYLVTPANVIGAVIGGIIGAVGGYFLSRFLADKIGLTGWKRNVFIWGLTAVITAAAAVIGYFIGPYIARRGKAAINSIKNALIKSACFVEGTAVLTDQGHVPIEQIKQGDLVYSENPETGEKGLKPVVYVFVNETDTLITITTETDEIITTEEHPFWVVGHGWVEAQDICSGLILKYQDGTFAEVKKVSVKLLESPIKVYNFEVQDWHTYFVSDSNILVHYACKLNFVRKSAAQIEKMLGAKSGEFHRIIKPDVLKSVSKEILKRVGSNPDILIAQDGTIQLVSTVAKGVSVITGLNIFDFIP